MGRLRRYVLILTIVVASLSIAGPAASTGFVTRSGTSLVLDGHPYRFTGLNIYNANSNGLCWYSMDPPILDSSLEAIGPGKGVFRAWFFQQLATVNGTRDWTRFDTTLAAARARGFKVIATLVDQWGNCGSLNPTGGFKDEYWYTTGYKLLDPVGTTSYYDYLAEVAARYKNDPTILAWQLVNEAEVRTSETGPCSLNAASILKGFAADASSRIKSIDPNHLVSIGTLGNGNCGASYLEYESLHDLSTVDLCELHDYYGPSEPIGGDVFNGVQRRIDQCHALGKPVFVGEAGIRPSDVDGTFEGRANAFGAKFAAQFAAGVVGELVWAWNREGSTVNNFDVGPGDPVLDELTTYGFHYDLAGFFAPVDSEPTVNRAKSGAAVPVKFSLGGNRGLDVFAAGFPKSRAVACDSSAPVDSVEETSSPGTALLSYDAASDRYTYVWKTDRSWSGCRQLVVRFGDGFERTAQFKFVR